MAYSNGSDGFTWLGEYHPGKPSTAIYCDACAETGAVPFDVRTCRECGAQPTRNHAPFTCDTCSAELRHHQESPWRWSPVGWFPDVDKSPCGKCGKPAGSGVAWYHRESDR